MLNVLFSVLVLLCKFPGFILFYPSVDISSAGDTAWLVLKVSPGES